MHRHIILKKILQITILIAVYLLTPSIVSAAGGKGAVTKSTEKPFRVAIPSFEMISGADKYKVLKRSIPEIIATGLIENKYIKYVSAGKFWIEAGKHDKIKTFQKSPEMLFRDKAILNELNIDLRVDGRFIIFRDTIKIDATLTIYNDTIDKWLNMQSREISLDARDVDDIPAALMPLIRQLSESLTMVARINNKDTRKRVAFLCFIDKSKEKKIENNWISDEIAEYLSWEVELDEESGLQYTPLSDTNKYCQDDHRDLSALMTDSGNKIDILISGIYRVNEMTDEMTINARIESMVDDLWHTSEIEHVVRKPDRKNYRGFEGLAHKVQLQIDALTGAKGEWNVDALKFRSKKAKDYIAKGRGFLENEDKKNLALASILFQKALDLENDNPKALYYLAKVYLEEGEYTRAEDLFKQIRENNDTSKMLKLRALLGTATARIKNNRMDDGNELRKLLDEEVNNAQIGGNKLARAEILIDTARVYISAGEYDSAEKVLNDAILQLEQLNQGEKTIALKNEASLLLGIIYSSTNKTDDAITTYKKALGNRVDDTDDKEIISNLVDTHLKRAKDSIYSDDSDEAIKLVEAIKHLDMAMELDTGNKEIYEIMMYLYNEQGNYDKSKILYTEAKRKLNTKTNKKPDSDDISAIIHNNAGYALHRLGKLKDAEKAFSKAAKLDVENSYFIYDNFGILLYETVKYSEALTAFDKSINNNMSFVYPYINKWRVLLRLGKYHEAVILLREAINMTYLDDSDLQLELAYTYALQGKKKLPGDMIKVTLDYPDDKIEAPTQYEIGRIYIVMKEYDKAKEALNKALDIDPHFNKAHIDMAYILGEENDNSGATTKLEIAIKSIEENIESVEDKSLKDELQADKTRAISLMGYYIYLNDKNRKEEALLMMNEAFKDAPSKTDPDYDEKKLYYADAEFHYNLARAYSMEGRLDEAIEELRNSKKIDMLYGFRLDSCRLDEECADFAKLEEDPNYEERLDSIRDEVTALKSGNAKAKAARK